MKWWTLSKVYNKETFLINAKSIPKSAWTYRSLEQFLCNLCPEKRKNYNIQLQIVCMKEEKKSFVGQ